MDPQREPGIRIDQVFLIESSFRHRSDFMMLPVNTEFAALEIGVEIKAFGSPDNQIAGVAVKVATNPEDETALYQFSVHMGAVVSAAEENPNFPPYQYVSQAGATFLYPFLRECVANLTARGRFGPIYLKPFNVRRALSAGAENETPQRRPARLKKRKKQVKSESLDT